MLVKDTNVYAHILIKTEKVSTIRRKLTSLNYVTVRQGTLKVTKLYGRILLIVPAFSMFFRAVENCVVFFEKIFSFYQ